MNYKQIIILFLLSSIFSCKNHATKFDKILWDKKEDLFFDYRKDIVNDLMKNHLSRGMHYKQVIQLIGEPQYKQDSTEISYEISVEFGRLDIDPIKSSSLVLQFNDSLLQNFHLEEYGK